MKRLLAALLAFLPTLLLAKVARTPLSSLVRKADVIAIVHVQEIQALQGRSWAHARVDHLLKGSVVTSDVFFLASHTWSCDIAGAVPEEDALVFLERFPLASAGHIPPAVSGPRDRVAPPASIVAQAYQLTFSGRGRMPLRTISNTAYATVWSDVLLPDSIRLIPGPDPRYSFIRSVALDSLLEAIRHEIVGKGAGT